MAWNLEAKPEATNMYGVGNKAKWRISKRVFQENKARQIFRKTNISYPLIRIRARAYQRVRNVRFSENLACFVFLKHPFWDSPFCFITEEESLTIFAKFSILDVCSGPSHVSEACS